MTLAAVRLGERLGSPGHAVGDRRHDRPAVRARRPPRMSFARLWAVLAILLPALAALIANLSSVDLAYHLRAGGEILDGGGIPTTDTWTFTALGQPWLDQQWGAQVILAAVYRLAGWTGLVLLRALLVGLMFGLRLPGLPSFAALDLRRAAWLTLAAFVVSAVALALRPQLFGMVLFALVLLVLVADGAHRPRLLWAIPVIVAVWANLHGSFFLGPVVLGLAWLEDVADRAPRARRDARRRGRRGAGRRCINPFGPAGLGLRRRPVDERRGHRADHRVAADDAADRPRDPVLRRRRSRVVVAPRAARARAPPGRRSPGSACSS